MKRIILILCLSNLAGCLASNPGDKYSGYDGLRDSRVCAMATIKDPNGIVRWRSVTTDGYVLEAKYRGLSCGVNAATRSALSTTDATASVTKKNSSSQTKTFILEELGFFTKDEICAEATWVDNRGIISWRSNLDPFVKAAKKTTHRCSVGSHVSDANKQVGQSDQIQNSGTQIGKMARVKPSKYKGYNSNNSNETKSASRSLKKEKTISYETASAYATYDPSSITPVRCSKTGGLFGINDRKCIDKISTICKRLYPKNESPKQAANQKTCAIKSLKQNYPRDADVNFTVPFLIKERAYYLLAHQGNISWAEATALNDQSVTERKRYFDEITKQRRARGLALANLGFCIASSGIGDCLGGSVSSNNPIRNQNGFLAQNYSVGANRVCVYNQVGSDHAITLPGTSLCPLSLNEAKAVDGQPKPKVGILSKEIISGFNKICVYNSGPFAWYDTVDLNQTCR